LRGRNPAAELAPANRQRPSCRGIRADDYALIQTPVAILKHRVQVQSTGVGWARAFATTRTASADMGREPTLGFRKYKR
jgi:hypothetical protein